jgi:hypothetical protein
VCRYLGYHRLLHRIGVYLTSIMFHEDKVLLTNEDLLPILEVQQDVPSSANLQVLPWQLLSELCMLFSLTDWVID